jgi:hypothetical protein
MLFAKRYSKVLAVCDKDIIGKRFKEGDLTLNLIEHASFYGQFVDDKLIIQWLEEAFRQKHSMNIVGKNSVALTLKTLKINRKPVLIEGVPILQVYFV